MKTLFLNRHAKSSWDHAGLRDFDRPLNDRGMRDAPLMAERLADRGEQVDAILSSTANRALTTAMFFKEKLSPTVSMDTTDDIYGAGVRTLLTVVSGVDDQIDNLIMFGHNPGFTDFANYLTGSDIYNIPTCGIVKIRFDINSWGEISGGTGDLVYFDYPKNENSI